MVLSKLINLFCCRHIFKTVFFHDSGYLSLQDRVPLKPFTRDGEADTPKIRTICSWNVQELFWHCSFRKLDNVLYHIHCLDAEVICLQEVFERNAIRSLIHNRTIRDKYPYFLTGNMKNKCIFGENSGLFVLSQYPLCFVDFRSLPAATFPDILASKGVLYFTVGDLNCAVTHLQSGSAKIAMKQLRFIIDQSPFKDDFVVLGDFNLEGGEILLGVERNNCMNTHKSGHIIDYILPMSDHISIETIVPHFNLDNVSDHYPIIGTITRTVPPLLN